MSRTSKPALSKDGRIEDTEKFLLSTLCDCDVAIDCCRGALVMKDKVTGEDVYVVAESGAMAFYTKDNFPEEYKK